MNRTLQFFALFFVGSAVAIGGGLYAFARQPESPSIDITPKESKETMEKATTQVAPKRSRSGYDITPLSQERIDELAKKLKPDEAKVILNKGTEPAFCGNLTDNKKDGTYICRLCELPLFSSSHKFHSGTGWPSFFQPVDPDHMKYIKDTSYGMSRIEILCSRCDAHLGHVFEDGPEPTGLRYCVNSVSLEFYDKDAAMPLKPVETKTAYFAGGCFWGVEDRFQQTPGVVNAVSGYMGGRTESPTYKQVCYSDTGHAETVMVTFDPTVITYRQLLERFFKYHDATTLNRQGPDVGTQYRSAIYATDDEQIAAARAYIKELGQKARYQQTPIVTEVKTVAEVGKFWSAEEYHQDYHEKNGGHCALPPSDEEE